MSSNYIHYLRREHARLEAEIDGNRVTACPTTS